MGRTCFWSLKKMQTQTLLLLLLVLMWYTNNFFNPAPLSQPESGHPTSWWTEKWSGSDHWDWARLGGDGVQWHGWKFGHDQKWKLTSILLLDVMPTCKWIFWREIQKCPPEGLSLHMTGCQQTCCQNWVSTQSCKQLTRPVLALCSKNKLYFLCLVRLCCKEKNNS